MFSVNDWISTAFFKAKQISDIDGSPRVVHRERSRQFVEALGVFARGQIVNTTERVLTKYHSNHREEFGLNELLYDVLWCDTATTPDTDANVPLRFITRGKWAVESEFARDSRQAIYDFNKLVLANTEAKLFIGPITSDCEAFLVPLASVAENVTGAMYVALVSHPSEWGSQQEHDPLVFRWSSGKWIRK